MQELPLLHALRETRRHVWRLQTMNKPFKWMRRGSKSLLNTARQAVKSWQKEVRKESKDVIGFVKRGTSGTSENETFMSEQGPLQYARVLVRACHYRTSRRLPMNAASALLALAIASTALSSTESARAWSAFNSPQGQQFMRAAAYYLKVWSAVCSNSREEDDPDSPCRKHKVEVLDSVAQQARTYVKDAKVDSVITDLAYLFIQKDEAVHAWLDARAAVLANPNDVDAMERRKKAWEQYKGKEALLSSQIKLVDYWLYKAK
jgi:hypothetical protein